MSLLPDNPSESFKKRNPHIYRPGDSSPVPLTNPLQTLAQVPGEKQSSKRIRQSSKPLLNKLETEFGQHLARIYPEIRIVPQGLRVKISGSSWFKVDFYLPARCLAFEVKGPRVMRNFQSRQLLALKVAAHQWPEITWQLATKQNGEWQIELVRPD